MSIFKIIRGSFRAKIQVAFFFIILALITGVSQAVWFGSEIAVKQRILTELTSSMPYVQQIISSKIETYALSIESALGDPIFRSQLGKVSSSNSELGFENSESLADVHNVFESSDLPLFRQYKVVTLLNDRHQLVFSTANTRNSGQSFENAEILNKVEEQGQASALISVDHELMRGLGVQSQDGPSLIVAHAVTVGPQFLGTIIVGEPISETILPVIENMTNAYVAISGEKPSFSPKLSAVGELANAIYSSIVKDSVNDQAFLRTFDEPLGLSASLIHKLHGMTPDEILGDVILIKSIEAELEPFNQRIRSLLAIIFIAVLGLSFFILSSVSKKLTSRLLELEHSTTLVEKGNLDYQIPVHGSDEISRLCISFNKMVVGLRERNYDGLTKIYNKRYFLESLDSVFERASRLGLPFTMIFFDLDFFKKINDVYGHEAGDFVLVGVATIATSIFRRREDILARYGGEEFIVILSGIDHQIGLNIAEKLRSEIESHSFIYEGKRLPVTTSVGVASLSSDLTTPQVLLKKADEAMYHSKHSGRNKVTSALRIT